MRIYMVLRTVEYECVDVMWAGFSKSHAFSISDAFNKVREHGSWATVEEIDLDLEHPADRYRCSSAHECGLPGCVRAGTHRDPFPVAECIVMQYPVTDCVVENDTNRDSKSQRR